LAKFRRRLGFSFKEKASPCYNQKRWMRVSFLGEGKQ
jgi:hypothetical protein